MNRKIIIKYCIIFLFMFLLQFLFNHFRYDTIYNFGMSATIVKGGVLYKDLNVIITPLYPFIMTIGLFIHNSFWIYLLEQSFLLTIFCYLLNKMIGKQSIIILFIISFSYLEFLFPNYNFFLVLLLLILMYCDKKEKSDYIIGVVLAALIFTKQNTGIVIYIVNIISTLSVKKAIKRTIPSIVFGLILIFYLLLNGALYNFVDLTILGLGRFANSNLKIDFCFLLVIFYLVYNFYFIYKNKSDKRVYYLLATYFFVYPICNRFHLIYFLVSNTMIMLLIKNYNIKLKLRYLLIFIICLNISYYSFLVINIYENNYVIKDNILSGYLINKDEINYVNKICDKYNSYDNAKIVAEESMLLDLYNSNELTYLDIPNHGNFGHEDVDKVINQIKKDKDTYYFVINDNNYSYQFAYEIVEFIKNEYKKADTIEKFDIYYIN